MERLPDIISGLPIWLQYTIAVLVALAIVGLPLPTIFRLIQRCPMFKLWPNREGRWYAKAIPTPPNSDIYNQPESNPDSAWKNNVVRWSNGKAMEIGDWYELYLGKPRVISDITVRTQGERVPEKVEFQIKGKKIDNWKTEIKQEVMLNSDEQNTIFQHRFKKHQKVEAIRFQIIKPNLKPIYKDGRSPAWAIYSIDFKEYRLSGCLWEAPIK